MEEKYENYLTNCWNEAEKLAIKFGITSNDVVLTIFKKISQPYHYWLKNEEKMK